LIALIINAHPKTDSMLRRLDQRPSKDGRRR
jgi:hypothetical protein